MDVDKGSADQLRRGVFVMDRTGEVFTKFGRAALGLPLWRAGEAETPPADAKLAVVAGASIDWDRVIAFAATVPTLIVARSASDEEAFRALTVGAIGYVPFAMPRRSFRRAVLAALAGDLVYSRRTLIEGLRVPRAISKTTLLKLTRRQRQVLALIATGAADKEIGAQLGIRPATAQKHAASLVKRLGVPNRAAAAATAYAAG